MYITQSEYAMEWGGFKNKKAIPLAIVPFNCCCLSLQTFDNPVCTPEGHIFDIINIIPFIKQYKSNPITGKPLKLTELIKVHLEKNKSGEYHDPISFKVFTEYSQICVIRNTGNVYT
jgi:peptidyl-prolyl cis-trans isomerase-like protein 2